MREDERNGQREEVVVHKRIGCKVRTLYRGKVHGRKFCNFV